MIESVSKPRPRRNLLIGTAAALLAELCGLVYMMDAYRGFWGEGAIGIFVFAVGMLVPSLLVLDRLRVARMPSMRRRHDVYGPLDLSPEPSA
jgi:hypothetical protein